MTYPDDLPQISVVFIFVNEALSVILRSVHSVVNHTPSHLLKEIIPLSSMSRVTCEHEIQIKKSSVTSTLYIIIIFIFG